MNADLTFNSLNAINLYSARFISQTGSLGTDVLRSVYVVGSDFYYNNGSGQAVQITAGSALNASSVGGITGLSGTTAGVAFISSSTTFTFTKAPNTASIIAVGDVNIYDTSGGTNAISFKNPGSLGAGYSLILPATVPSNSSSIVISKTGQLSYQTVPPLSGVNVPITGTTSINLQAPTVYISGTDLSLTRNKLSITSKYNGNIIRNYS